jgi:hypothetical protein
MNEGASFGSSWNEFDTLQLALTAYTQAMPDPDKTIIYPYGYLDAETGNLYPPGTYVFGLIYGDTSFPFAWLLDFNPGGFGAANNRWMQGPDPVAVARSMRYGVETMTPTVCGGGGFGYAGKGATAFGVKGFSGGIVEWDSSNGWTGGTLKEAGAGGLGGGFMHTNNGLLGLGYVELVEIPGVADAGAVGGKGWAGGYAEGGLFGAEVGGGAYANVTSVAACQPW